MKSNSTEAGLDEQHALVSIGRVRALFGDRSRQWIYDQLRKNPSFPKPVQLGAHTIAWRLSELHEFIADLPRVVPTGLSGAEQRAIASRRREGGAA